MQKEDKMKENPGNKLSNLGGDNRLYRRGQAVKNRQGAGNRSCTQSRRINKNTSLLAHKNKKTTWHRMEKGCCLNRHKGGKVTKHSRKSST